MNRNKQRKMGYYFKSLVIVVMAVIMIFVFAGCGGEDSSDQGSNSAAVTDGIQGVVYTVPAGWDKNDVSKDQNSTYDDPAGDVSIGVSTITDENLGSFVDIQEVKTVEEYYKQRTTPSKEDTYDEEFESTTLLGQDATVSRIKHAGGYVDIATYCMLDGIMYNFFISRNNAFEERKIKPNARVLSDEELATYENFLKSAKTGDGASLQMEGVTADGLGEIAFDAPDGFTLISVSDYYVGYESKSKARLNLSIVREEDLKYYTDDDGKECKTLKDFYEIRKKEEEGEKDIKIAGWEGFEVADSINHRETCFVTKEAVYQIYVTNYDFENDQAVELTKEEISAYDKFVESIRKK